MFLNAILTNAEVWYNLTNSDIEELEELDRCLLRKFLGTKMSCPKEALFLETGALPIGVLIKSKREKMRAPPSAPAYPGYNTGPADD